MHVAMADQTVAIGAAPPAESYLRADHNIDAAQSTGADAIHPRYGFRSETQTPVAREPWACRGTMSCPVL